MTTISDSRAMTLSEKQRLFSRMTLRLFQYLFGLGYDFTYGDAYRDPRVFGKMGERIGYGSKNSCHKLRLAIDINLFVGGKYTQDSNDYRSIGEFWESIGGTWGGRFQTPDGNHFSIEHDGFE